MSHESRLDSEVIVESPLEVSALDDGFRQFGVSEKVVEALALRHIHGTFPIQALVLKDAIAGRDVLAKSQTGSGKTLAYAIPIVERITRERAGASALVLVPTRELATQVAQEFRGIAETKGLKVATVYGGIGIAPQAKEAAKADILIATPGRLLDLVRRRLLRLDQIRICILDEADRMLDMGFLPDVGKILSMLPKKRQSMLFSATLDGEVGSLAARYTTDPVLHQITEVRPVVSEAVHRFVTAEGSQKIAVLVRELASERGLTLIFVRTKRSADRLARTLKSEGFMVQALHGDMTQPARERTLARFESGKADVLVATDVAARGLDLEHITHVVNYDAPEDEIAYVHRAGRTARAGRGGEVLTLVTPGEEADVGRFAARLKLLKEMEAAGLSRPAPRRVFSSGPRRRGGRRR
ncbi:MAG: DEAD/DEAH box helicase [Actinomycetota bacterium]